MTDLIITALILLIIGAFVIYKVQFQEAETVFDIDRTLALDFIFSIVIIFVHIPEQYQNCLSDFVGSFAYIGVSFFCMKAAYGVKYSYDNKENYLKKFWNVRLKKILLPLLVVCIISFIYCFYNSNFNMFCLFYYDNIYGWIRVLLLFYIEFYLVYIGTEKVGNAILIKYRDAFLALLIISQSIMDYTLHYNLIKGWNIERIGFVIGIILYNNKATIKKYIVNNWNRKIILFLISTLLFGGLYLKFKESGFVGSYLIRGGLETTFLILIITIILKVKFQNRLIKIGGGIAYNIYVCHPLVFIILCGVCRKITSGAFIGCTIVLTAILSYIISLIQRKLVKIVSGKVFWRK